MCEYKIIISALKTLAQTLNFSNVKYKNIKPNLKFPFFTGLDDLNGKNSKFFYNNLIKKKFVKPYYQKKLSEDYGINDRIHWENIYLNKIRYVEDSQLADFNYRLLNNILCNNAYLSKWKSNVAADCRMCDTLETCEHLIYNCRNVQSLWKLLSLYLKFDVKWKHIAVGFYFEKNRKTLDLNFIISYIAFKIYKYKMYCRLEKKDEKEFEIRNHVKLSLVYYSSALSYVRNKKSIQFIQRFVDKL